ncbi:hypothetical protein [Methylobacterium sp. yr596]|uniref:hypothetical protein n=1 Tax=Methylobacterium sp. yr596 TaxID=1761800 RepID=UPI0008E5F910|nr:hypothetical protein [Methylobacterium sp. yr596]SFF22251.1 hypothetical protein SAMN04487844_1125 [Methylobacterium sp. yr596]
MSERLTDEQVNRAYRLFYGDEMSLREIMRELDCGLYDLAPWLTAPASRIAAAAIAQDRKERAAPAEARRGRLRRALHPKGDPDV